MTSPYSDPIRIGFLLRFMISTFSLQCIRYLSFNSSRLSQFMTSGLFIPVCYDLFTPMVWCSCYDLSAPIIRSLMRLRFLTTSPIQLIPLSDDSALLYSDLSWSLSLPSFVFLIICSLLFRPAGSFHSNMLTPRTSTIDFISHYLLPYHFNRSFLGDPCFQGPSSSLSLLPIISRELRSLFPFLSPLVAFTFLALVTPTWVLRPFQPSSSLPWSHSFIVIPRGISFPFRSKYTSAFNLVPLRMLHLFSPLHSLCSFSFSILLSSFQFHSTVPSSPFPFHFFSSATLAGNHVRARGTQTRNDSFGAHVHVSFNLTS